MGSTSDLDQQIEEAVDRKLDEKLRHIIREELQALIPITPHKCRFSMNDEEAGSMSKYVKSISRLGGDDIEDGLDLIRENHKWLQSMRQGGGKAASVFFMMLLTGAAGAFLTILWTGFKEQLR
jgi:hypothetical protein